MNSEEKKTIIQNTEYNTDSNGRLTQDLEEQSVATEPRSRRTASTIWVIVSNAFVLWMILALLSLYWNGDIRIVWDLLVCVIYISMYEYTSDAFTPSLTL